MGAYLPSSSLQGLAQELVRLETEAKVLRASSVTPASVAMAAVVGVLVGVAAGMVMSSALGGR